MSNRNLSRDISVTAKGINFNLLTASADEPGVTASDSLVDVTVTGARFLPGPSTARSHVFALAEEGNATVNLETGEVVYEGVQHDDQVQFNFKRVNMNLRTE
jgi:hypothetical protein